MLCIVEAVTDNPFVSDIEAQVVCLDFDFGTFCFAYEGAGLYGCRAMRLEHANQVLERVTRVDDVLNDEYVFAFYVAAYVHDEAYRAR